MIGHLAGDFGPRQTLPNDLAYAQIEAVTVGHVLAVVIAESLLIEVAESVERLHADVGATDGPLERNPVVFHSVRVTVALHVGNGVVDQLMSIV